MNSRLTTMSSWLWILLLLLLAFQNGGRSGIHVSANDRSTCNRSTTNTGSEIILGVGEDLTLTCLTDSNNDGADDNGLLTWYKNDTALDIETMTTNDDRYMILNTADDSCIATDLSISDVQETDGGTYVCSGSNTNAVAVNVTVCPVLPDCSWRLTIENATGLDDTVELTCKTCQITSENYSTYLVSWSRYDGIELEDVGNFSPTLASAVIDIYTALASQFTCHFTDYQRNTYDEFPMQSEASCEVELVTVFPEFQTVQEGGNASFTCHVYLKGYSVDWFEFTTHLRKSSNVVHSNDNQTSTISLHCVQEGQIALLCIITNIKSGDIVSQKLVNLNVLSNATNVSTASTVSTMPQSRIANLYVKKKKSNASSALSLTYVIVIAVCGSSVFFLFVIIIGFLVYRCHRRNTTQANIHNDSSPALYSDTVSPDLFAQHNHPHYEDMSYEIGGKYELTSGITNPSGGETTGDHNLERSIGKETSDIGNTAQPCDGDVGPTYERVD